MSVKTKMLRLAEAVFRVASFVLTATASGLQGGDRHEYKRVLKIGTELVKRIK